MVVEHAHGLRQRRGPNAKSSLHKAHLAPDAGLQAPGASLSFAQGSHDFESLDRGIGRGDRFETAHRLDQYLELSVIGLDHVIEILHLPVGRLPVQLSFALQFGDRCTIARRFVGIERGRLFPVLQASQGLAQEPLRCLGAAGRRQVEIDRVAPLVDCPVQVGPLAPHLDVGFIQAPARIKATPPEPAQPLLHLRGVALDPAIDRRMVDRNAAFRQHFLKVAIADRIATIPAHRPQDHITLEMAPLEIRHRSVRPISAKHAQASRFLQQSPWWYRVPTSGPMPESLLPRLGKRRGIIAIPREDYAQVAYMGRKGTDAQLRARGIEALREDTAFLAPELADQVSNIASMDDIKHLDVRMDRLRRWHAPGVLCIGDAAHAMSPVGGMGINLAVQDALAAARLLARPLARGALARSKGERFLARVQRRRTFPTVVVQALQRFMHARILAPVLKGEMIEPPRRLLSLVRRVPILTALPAAVIGIGPRPEKVPAWARRSPRQGDSVRP